MAKRVEDDERPSFPKHLENYNPDDGWADERAWWKAKVAFARERGVYGRTASGVGRILPMIQELTRQAPSRVEPPKKNDKTKIEGENDD